MNIQGKTYEELKEEVLETIKGKSSDEIFLVFVSTRKIQFF